MDPKSPTRLLDRLKAHGCFQMAPMPDPRQFVRSFQDELSAVLPACVPVVCDNVVEWYFATNQQETFKAHEFPNVLPPFGAVWLESYRPTQISSEVHGITPWNTHLMPSWWGCTLVSVESERLLRDGEPGNAYKDMAQRFPQAKWWVVGRLFMATPHALLDVLRPDAQRESPNPRSIEIMHSGKFMYGVLPNGQMLADETGDALMEWWIDTPAGLMTEAERDKMAHAQAADNARILTPLLFAIGFMHAKNVAQPEVRADAPSRAKLSKKWKRDYGVPLVTYRVLDIGPLKAQVAHEGASAGEGFVRAAHICRGHFKTYGGEGRGKLFGRLEGTFWVPAHERGDETQGRVEKAYNVEAP